MEYLWVVPVVLALLVVALAFLAFRGSRRRRAHLFLLTTDSVYQASHAGELHEHRVGDFRGPEAGRRELRLLDFMHSCGDIGHKRHKKAVEKIARKHQVSKPASSRSTTSAR